MEGNLRAPCKSFAASAVLLNLLSCGGSVEPKDDSGLDPANPEEICDDQIDNDQDGQTDCDDSDCASAFECTWPDEFQHTAGVYFDASSAAELLGYDDCEIVADAVLKNDDISACTICDRSYTGALTYSSDDCDMIEDDRPDSVTYGLIFLSETERVYYGAETDGPGWAEVGRATLGPDGAYTITTEENVDVEGFDAGDLTVELIFRD